MKNRALNAYWVCRKHDFFFKIMVCAAAWMLSACAVLDKPVQAAVYDFGSGDLSSASPANRTARPLVLGDVDAPSALDNTGVMYRLAYADDQQLRPYALARWSMPPAQLVRQHLRDRLNQSGVVLSAREAAALGKSPAGGPLLLRLELEAFSQRFDDPQRSAGVVKLRAVLIEISAGAEKLLDQRVLVMQRPAPSPDAAGGVRAMKAATDALADELNEWLKAWR